jgi:hypothetical protein
VNHVLWGRDGLVCLNESLEETARRIVDRLSADELAELVADWLDARTAI